MQHALTRAKKSIFSSCIIGNLLEHYDTALYGFLAPFLAPLFFPEADPVVALILAYGIMATSFLTRPSGVLFFAHYIQKYGAGASLSLSLKGVAVTTFAMGLLPTYETLGMGAPILLVFLRLLQSFFGAGETSLAPQYLLTLIQDDKKVRANSFYQSSSVGGILLASTFVTLIVVYDRDLWRLAFLLGSLTALLALGLRRIPANLDDFPASVSFRPLLKNVFSGKQAGSLLKIIFLSSFTYLTYAIPFVFMNGFVPNMTKITYEEMIGINTTLLVLDMFLISFLGRFLEKKAPRTVMLFSAFCYSILILPAFFFLEDAALPFVTGVRVMMIILGMAYLLPYNVYLHGALNARDRYLLPGLGYAIGAEAIGKTAPALCLSLWYTFKTPVAPALYISAIGLLVTCLLLFSKDNLR